MGTGMIEELKTLKEQVVYILEHYRESRNSDTLLTRLIWEKFHNHQLRLIDGEYYAPVSYLGMLPREDHVKRIRAHVQNVEKRYIPTSWEVAKQRQWLEEEWHAFLDAPILSQGSLL